MLAQEFTRRILYQYKTYRKEHDTKYFVKADQRDFRHDHNLCGDLQCYIKPENLILIDFHIIIKSHYLQVLL